MLNRKHLLLLLLILMLTLGSFLHFQRGRYGLEPKSLSALGSDDAYISYRYGWNLTNYNTLSWNESGYRRVEGFSNPLWVYTSALWALLGNKAWIYPLMVSTSVAIVCALLLLLAFEVYKINGRKTSALFGLLLVAATPVIWLHTTSGLEGGIFGFALATLAYLAVFNDNGKQGNVITIITLSSFLCLLRSDGFVYVFIILISALIAKRSSWRWITIGLISGTAVLFSWRLVTFGHFLPNTAIAKVNHSVLERLRMGVSLFISVLFISGLPVFLILYFSGLLQKTKHEKMAGIFLLAAWIGYYLFIGGDYLLDRHLIGIIILAGAISGPLWIKIKPALRAALWVTLLFAVVFSSILTYNRFDYQIPKERDPWVMLGQKMSENRDYYGVFVTSIAGKIPFFAGGECVDSWGLNDPYLATIPSDNFFPGHSSGDKAEAVDLALNHPIGFYTTFTGLDPVTIAGPEMIALWINTLNPQEEVQTIVSNQDCVRANQATSDRVWSIITKPFTDNIYREY